MRVRAEMSKLRPHSKPRAGEHARARAPKLLNTPAAAATRGANTTVLVAAAAAAAEKRHRADRQRRGACFAQFWRRRRRAQKRPRATSNCSRRERQRSDES